MKLTLIAALAAIVGLASVSATPEKEERRKHRDQPLGHHVKPHPDRSFHLKIKEWIEKFDKDGDGKLSTEERKTAGEARKAEFLKKWDKDGDGKLNTAEKKAAGEALRKQHGRKPRPAGGVGGVRPDRSERPKGGRPRPERPERVRPEGRKPHPKHKRPAKKK